MILADARHLPIASEHWKVLRHSGRGGGPESDGWRVVGWYRSEEQARGKFDDIRRQMRQGGVRLLRPDDSIVAEYGAPRVRSRW